MGIELETRIRNVTAVLGPTNTGKTHLAIERMLGHQSGLIGLPLRLLAREVYDRIVARVGAEKCALITGEEKIKPEGARFWVCTVEAMPREIDVDFLAIDEVQLASDPERGHVFTDRLLHARGRTETLLLGAQTMREAISDLIPGANFISRPRLSKLTYSGQKKITRLPARSAIVTFSANEVYAVAELIRRQHGGAAVVLGALSPRTRNAQVELYQSGDVDFLVATDAIGMGLNLDVDHVAFAAIRKFDGQVHRNLTPAEASQIAGRAGRHMNDGTFGVTGSVEPFENDLIERLETHTFDSVKVLQWRNRDISFGSIDQLRDSLREMPRERRLARARMADDQIALENISNDAEILRFATTPSAVERLWEVCQVPDYRKISAQNHAELASSLYKFLMGPEGRIPEDWFGAQVALADRADGDIDTLATRIAHIRTWTFVSNRSDWLKDPEHWQGRTRQIEDTLSDALHERLTQRFVDRRTSVLMRGMREGGELSADIADDGSIKVEDHFVGRLTGFRFAPDAQAEGIHGKAARHAATQVVTKELAMRARRVAAAKNEAFKLTRRGRIVWRDEDIAKVDAAEDPLKPVVTLIADEHVTPADREKVQNRLETWLSDTIAERLKPLVEISKAEDISGLARGIAFRLTENFGILKREGVASEIKSLDQTARAQLRKYGIRFGAFNIFFPVLLKPAAADLTLTLWSLKHAAANGLDLDALPEPPRPGLTSTPADPAIPEAFYRACGYHVCGPRSVRVDILERLADLLRQLISWRATADNATRVPKGATGDGGFTVTPEMMSILGCSTDELGNVLKTLGFRMERRKVRPAPEQSAPPETVATSATPIEPAATATGDTPTQAAGVQPDTDQDEAAPGLDSQPDAQPDTGMTAVTESVAEAQEPTIAGPEASEGQAGDAPGTATSDLQSQADTQVATEANTPDAGEPLTATGAGAEAPADALASQITSQADDRPAETDAPTGTVQAGGAVAEEDVWEEVWKPRRHRDDRPQRQHGRGGERSRSGRGRQGQRAHGGSAPDRQPDQTADAAQASHQGAAPSAGVPGSPERTQDNATSHGRGRQGDPRRDNRRKDQGRDQGHARSEGGKPRDGDNRRQRDRDQRPGQGRGRDDRRRHEDRNAPQVRSAGPNKKGGVDPDSPFAALSSLKLALERETQDPQSS